MYLQSKQKYNKPFRRSQKEFRSILDNYDNTI